MKRSIVVVLTLFMLFGSVSMAMAAEPIVSTDAGAEVRQAVTDREAAVKRIAATRTLFETYYPEGLEQFEELVEDHREFHSERLELKREILAEFREQVREALQERDLEALRELWQEQDEFREAASGIWEDKKEENQVIREAGAAVREEIKALLAEEVVDEEKMVELLNEVLDLMEQHLELDIYYAGLIDALLAE